MSNISTARTNALRSSILTRYVYGAIVASMGMVHPAMSRAQVDVPNGRNLFQKNCAGCHSGAPDAHATDPVSFRERSPESILAAMTGGTMRYQSLHLSGAERRAVAEYLTGKEMGGDLIGATTGRCTATAQFRNSSIEPSWNGWSPTTANTHFQSGTNAGLSAAQVQHLTLKWAFGFPDAAAAWSQPTVVGGRVFVGSQNGTVYSLDAKTGCIYWTFSAAGGVRTAVTIGPRKTAGGGSYSVYFSDIRGAVYALDAITGKLVWKQEVESSPSTRATGSPTLYNGRLYVPMAAFEEINASDPTYECCTFRGSLAAVDAGTGGVLWKTYLIREVPKVLGKGPTGIRLWGPSGGGVWATPTIDPKRGVAYVAVGNGSSGPQQLTTDSITAISLKDGKIRWSAQPQPKDIWIYGCDPDHKDNNPNCPDEVGPDADFGMPAVLTTLPNGKDLLIAGQKSGIAYALDPDRRGAIIWEYRAGMGGILGGLIWGIGTDEELAYIPVSDISLPLPGGLHAVNLVTGKRVWYAAPQPPKCASGPGCNAAQAAAVTVIPGIVFSGSNDGALRAYSTKDGSIIWEFDTNREFETLNGVHGKGASLISAGPTIVGGMVYVNSGYGFSGGRPGNVLLAFGVE